MGKSNGGTKCLRIGYWIPTYLLLMLLTVIETVKGDALISSWLLNCTRDKNNKLEEDVDCLKKMLLQLSILNGKSGRSDTVETFVTNVRQHDGVVRDLEEPYRITTYKSDIYAQYPLQYIQSFDGFPREVELFAPDCKDGSKEKNPDCGWLYNEHGEKLKDSQGFCCLCTLKDKLPWWLGGHSSSRRSKQDCNSTLLSFLNLLPLRRRGSAHCLRHSTQWYPTYKIGASNQAFTITVVAHLVYSSREVLSLSRTYSDFVEVTSQQRVNVNSGRTLKGVLQVHSVLTMEPPLLTGRYLSIPYEAGTLDVSANNNKWLALPKSFYTLDGSGCDKIGVSYNAFRSQVQPCSRVFKSCFGNQLDKFSKEETERLAHGEKPLYSLSRYGKIFASHQTRNSTLNLLMNQTVTSLLSLELKADDLKFYVHRSPGKIMDASIAPPISNLSDGLLKVEILNKGRNTANFTLHTEECPLQLKMSAVEVSSSKPRNILSSFTFNLSETDDISHHSTCKVFLQDNMGDRTDVFEVKFDYPSREELAYLLRAETTQVVGNNTSWSEWFWALFNWTRWFGGFNTSFNWCWFSCPTNTIETESSNSGFTFKCEYGGAVQQSIGEGGLIKCPGPPQNSSGVLGIFNWTPCGECRNIIADFGCYVTTLCWREILSFLMYFAGIFFIVYLIWLLNQVGLLRPTVQKILDLIGIACKFICSCLTIIFRGRDSGRGGKRSDDSNDEDGGGGRARLKRKKRRKRKRKKKRHKMKGHRGFKVW